MTLLAKELATLSALEMVRALGVGGAPALVQKVVALPLIAASRTLGRTLADLDQAVGVLGLALAATQALQQFGVELSVAGACPARGAALVLANHPGAYDALALMSASGRNDLMILAADRSFLRALPRLSGHLVFVSRDPVERAQALKCAISQLRRGAAVLHFPAGEIEPDAEFEPGGADLLRTWQPGVSALARACARADGLVVVAGVRGVHSARAKRLALTRLAERRGITTLAPLAQMVLGFRDVRARVVFGEPQRAERLVAGSGFERAQAELRSALFRAISAA